MVRWIEVAGGKQAATTAAQEGVHLEGAFFILHLLQ